MDGRLRGILGAVPEEVLAGVAGEVLGRPGVGLEGVPDFVEIRRPHAEDRTIGIVRVSGAAAGREWSSVVKLVDLGVAASGRTLGMTWPENEEFVYERRHFADEGLHFRPARCYAVTRPSEQLKLFWLEDLTSAQGTPFSLEQIAQMARHLGEWNGHHAGTLPDLGFALGRDAYVWRTRGWNYASRLAELDGLRDHRLVRATFGDRSTDEVKRLVAVVERLVQRALSAPHGLAFGDCSAGNLFHRPDETVAIDWASLTDDPVGVDGGCFIGSTFSWGADFIDVVRAESELFDSYVAGLRAGGWRGARRDARRAALAQMGGYLATASITPALLANGDDWVRGFIEGRFGLRADDICAGLADLVGELSRYSDEIEALLA